MKDNYLKSLMDDDGFVKLGQISHFHRIKDCPPYQVSGNGFLKYMLSNGIWHGPSIDVGSGRGLDPTGGAGTA